MFRWYTGTLYVPYNRTYAKERHWASAFRNFPTCTDMALEAWLKFRIDSRISKNGSKFYTSEEKMRETFISDVKSFDRLKRFTLPLENVFAQSRFTSETATVTLNCPAQCRDIFVRSWSGRTQTNWVPNEEARIKPIFNVSRFVLLD